MHFLIDMNLSPLWAETLREQGHEATHWSAVGRFDAPDPELMSYARANGMVVFTHDLDYGTLLAQTNAEGPSVVQLREQNVDPQAIGPAVVAALAQCAEALDRGALVTIDLRRAKARLLPLRG